MDLRQLRYFVAVADHGSISVAAQALHIAQPALTRQIQGLEGELDTRLFERTPRGMRLTGAGEQLLTDASKLLEDASMARDRAQRAGRGEMGHLSLALPVLQSLSPPIAEILKAFRKEVPAVAMTVHHLLSDAQLRLMTEGRLDAGFLLFRPRDDQAFDGVPIFSERMLLACPAEWRWPKGLPRVLKDLEGLDFIWLPRSAAPAWHDRLIHCFFNAGFVPRPAVQGVDVGSMLALVAAGMGCTILPESAVAHAPKTVTFMPLADLTIRQDWELVWRSERCSAVLKRLIGVVAMRQSLSETTRPRGKANRK